MGFAPVASVSILLVATFQVLGGTIPDVLDSQAALDEAREEVAQRNQLLSEMDATITGVSSGASFTEVTADNNGDKPIRMLELVLVLDGEPVAPTAWSVDSKATDIWLPGETATISVTSGPHQFIALSLPDGTLVHWGA